ncbi:MAG: CDC48 family AAA ATPase [Thermoproteota archaeon]
MSEIQLLVAEARPRDVGRRIVRIGKREMTQLNADTGDIVEIVGRKTASAVVWPGYGEDENRKIVRMDGLIRKSAGVAIGDYVKIRKVDKVENANEVVFAPMGVRVSNVDEEFLDYVKDKLIDTPLTEGDIVAVPVFGGQALGLTVIRVKPRGFVKVTANTRLQLVSEEAAEKLAIPRVTYEDIGGLHEEIQRIREMVELPLRHPELFQRLGIEPPKGVLLHGPPGTGKTLLAKAVANESDATFLSINGPEIMSKFYGESEERLRRVFQEAQEKAPSIIFIDEIDAIAPKREEVGGEVERRVVAQLLALMDGLKSRGDVIVIGATNVVNMIDPALRRPGRFDREIEIGVPDKQGRLEILQIHTRSMPLEKDVDLKKLAEITHGYTGADLAALSREAAMKALRRYLPEIKLDEKIPQSVLEKMVVKEEDFMNAFKEITPTAMREVYVEVPTVRWSDVGGLEGIKRRLMETVELPIKSPEKFEKLGITPPKAILLYGPPGCGKTLLARAVATESEANFISIKGPEVFSKWVGESEKAIREVFRKARLSSPSIIFLDEVDAIAPRRGMSMADSGVTERVVSQLLTEMDGLTPIEKIVIVGATNRPELLDPAIMRPGRFEVILYVPPPDEASRLQILKIHTGKMPLKDVSLEEVAKKTEGYSGADLEALCREAGLNALRRDAENVTKEDFEKALQTVKPSLREEMLLKYKKFEEKEEPMLI